MLYMLDSYAHYRLFYNQWSQALKKIKEILGLPELSTYWARHTWATIAASLDIPKETIAAALGHVDKTEHRHPPFRGIVTHF